MNYNFFLIICSKHLASKTLIIFVSILKIQIADYLFIEKYFNFPVSYNFIHRWFFYWNSDLTLQCIVYKISKYLFLIKYMAKGALKHFKKHFFLHRLYLNVFLNCLLRYVEVWLKTDKSFMWFYFRKTTDRERCNTSKKSNLNYMI